MKKLKMHLILLIRPNQNLFSIKKYLTTIAKLIKLSTRKINNCQKIIHTQVIRKKNVSLLPKINLSLSQTKKNKIKK
jgi:hypothetical protein